MSNFGAMDLSGLTKKDQPQTGQVISDWLVPGDESTLRTYLALSESTPVLMLITDQSEPSQRVRALVSEVIKGSAGRFAGIEISIEDNPQLAQAVAVSQAPAMLAILAGQPAPLFQGEATRDQLVNVLGQVLQMAAEKNITSQVTVGAAPTAPEKPLPPEHQAAIAAIDAGDLEKAQALYEKLIVEYPNDSEAKAGLAQVKFMIRLASADLGGDQESLEVLFAAADKLLVAGQIEQALMSLIERFEADFDNREAIQERLLELFVLIGDAEPAVLEARRKLANLMF